MIVNIVFILFYLQVEPVYLRASNKPIQITSRVINIGNNDRILVVSGRLHNSDLPLSQREPVVLSHDSILSSIIVKHFHDQAPHGVEWTLSDLREKFWITRARVLVKRIHKRCLKCKRFFRAVASQKMADLPPERLIARKSPFHVTGCDYFDPFPVKYKRSTVLRYGCVFTCMNI